MSERGGFGRVLVVIPTYQERDNIAAIIGRTRTAAPDVDILVADDASPDGTGKIADELAAGDAAVHVLHREAKEGLGSAYVAGFRWAAEHGYGAVVEMDADGSHQPEQLPALLAALEEADVVLGSRWVDGGAVHNWPATRMALSRAGNVYARLVLRLPLHDATGGFRVYRLPVLDAIDLSTVRSQGYCFQVDMAWRAWRQGFRVVEVPITFVERELGTSKMSRGHRRRGTVAHHLVGPTFAGHTSPDMNRATPSGGQWRDPAILGRTIYLRRSCASSTSAPRGARPARPQAHPPCGVRGACPSGCEPAWTSWARGARRCRPGRCRRRTGIPT